MTRAFGVFALMFAFACNGSTTKTESGDSGTTLGSGSYTTSNPGSHIDSCVWNDLGLCYEFTDFDGTQAWCDSVDAGSTTISVAISTTYHDAPCDQSDVVYTCNVPGVGAAGAANEPATVYYDSTANDPAASCAQAGGTGE